MTKTLDSQRPLCRFFLMGSCAYGAECTYRHDVTQEGGIEAAKKSMICPFIKKNGKKCRHKDRCWFSHAKADENRNLVDARSEGKVNLEKGAAKIALPVDATTTLGSSNSQKGSTDRKTADKAEESNRHKTECGICQNNIPLKGRRFALLSNCPHIFCLECIKMWHEHQRESKLNRRTHSRTSSDLVEHSCPVCRQHSEFVLPQKEFCSGEVKALKIEQYKKERSSIPCKHFKGTIGSCPFGSDCIFAHVGPDGQDLKPADKEIREMKMTRTLEEEGRGDNDEMIMQDSTVHSNNQQIVQENDLYSRDVSYDDSFLLLLPHESREQGRDAAIETNVYGAPRLADHNSPRPRDQHRLIGDDGRADDLLDQLINGAVDVNTAGAVPESSSLPDPMSVWSSSFHNNGRESQTSVLPATSRTESTLHVNNAFPPEISFFDTFSNFKEGTETNANNPHSSQESSLFGNNSNNCNDFSTFASDLWNTDTTETSAINSNMNTSLDGNNENTNENAFLTFGASNDSNIQSLSGNFVW